MKNIKAKILSLVRDGDVLAKAICLLLAVILWVLVASSKTETVKYRIPITPVNLSPQLSVSGMSEKFATVLLEGKGDELRSISPKSIKVTVNLENVVIGEAKSYPVVMEKQQIPDEISVSLGTREIMLTVERKEEKWVKVIPVLTGRVQHGKMVVDKMAIPDRVKISGLRSLINDIETVETDDVSVENESGDIQRQVGLRRDDKLRDVTFFEKFVTVKVFIADMKDFTVLTAPLGIRYGARDFDYEIKDTEVEVYVRQKNYPALNVDDLDVFVDVGKVNLKKIFEDNGMHLVYRELPVTVIGKNINAADIISFMPRKVLVKIARKQNP